MALTPAQKTTLKTDMHSGGNAAALGTWLAAADWASIATWYNTDSGSTVWRPSIPVSDLTRNIVGTVADGLSTQKQQGYIMLTQGALWMPPMPVSAPGLVTSLGQAPR